MRPIKRILVGTDLSDEATYAVQYAVDLANLFDAEITLVQSDLFLPPIGFPESGSTYYLEVLPELRETALRRLHAYAEEFIPRHIRRETKIVVGTPHETIVEHARAMDADLIVVGTHGRTGMRRFVLGSVAESVVHSSEVPVLTVRRPATYIPRSERIIRRILCPVNFTAVARQAFDMSVLLAERFGAQLVVVHVKERNTATSEDVRSWLPESMRETAVYRELTLSSHPAEQILEYAREVDASLLVVGAEHKKFGDATVIGTTSERITRYSLRPVLTVIAPKVAALEARSLERDTILI